MMFPVILTQWFVLGLFILSASSTAKPFDIPRLSPTGPRIVQDPEEIFISELVSDDLETFFYNQTLDHFNYNPESYETFQQRYIISSKYWGGANSSSPIFVYFGAEAPLDGDLTVIGFLADNAAQFNALLLYIEHRYYGKSVPFGSQGEALKNGSIRGYFNSAQAIADYAEIIIHVKKNLQAENSPVIVIGGSYGGMLASWFRLKYPHLALGALASSAPVLYFDDITPQDGYYSIASRDFREASENCYKTIQKSWAEIDGVASMPKGLDVLSKKFKTCKPLTDSDELKDRLDSMYSGAAQYNKPPTYPVNIICSGIDGAASSSNDTLDKIFAGVVAYRGNRSCYINPPTNLSETSVGWRWQTCSEMVIPIGRGNDTMFPPSPFDLNGYVQDCKAIYGVRPRPHWVTTYYGGHSIKLILQRFGSNIIFSNGLRDPYSSGGVLEDISDTILAVHTANGSHCLDILIANETTDPEWLVAQRKTEINIIKGWISKYYDDLSISITN
ncbi:lysosomal Pro-X carboxypeptidase [Ricinus communis]|uniref:lysosomal Pro-X carboxypeptidase n=1 Tax=Ricinus communis TaxID=3988 RepID=UPI00201ABA48|nr:lysosomal Pro-X carboxypeptidase [Ricinus communis]